MTFAADGMNLGLPPVGEKGVLGGGAAVEVIGGSGTTAEGLVAVVVVVVTACACTRSLAVRRDSAMRCKK